MLQKFCTVIVQQIILGRISEQMKANTYMNTLAVPYGLDSASHSVQQPVYPLQIYSLDSLPSALIPEDNLNVVPPTRTYKKWCKYVNNI
jgi:hypothetical protein